MSVRVGALVLTTSRLSDVVAFYRAVGLPLKEERHDDGPRHFACNLHDVHFAVFSVHGEGRAPSRNDPGCSFIGIQVPSVDELVSELESNGTPVHQRPDDAPWGRRAVVEDPDGRPVELFAPPH